jgi:hypothetical protein
MKSHFIIMKKIFVLLFICCNCSITILAQNVGINSSGAAPANCAMLDIAATDKGLLVPRVALTAVGTYAPLTGTAVNGLLVYSTAAPTGGNGTGYYYWTGAQWANLIDNVTPGNPWYVGGNLGTTASTSAYGVAANNSYIGTNDNQAMVFATNTFERMRIRNDGEVVVGAVTTVIADDLFSAVSNNTLDWAVNGYSGFDGSGIYGQVTGGATIFAAVQGEYNGTNAQGAGVRGSILNTTAGSSLNALVCGVTGISTTAGAYKFGVYGTGATTARSGGVLGNDYGLARGALGYYAANGLDYSVYGFGQAHTNGLAAGRMAAGADVNVVYDQPNTNIGLGIYGGVMGGWVKGLVYGTNFSGQKYGLYVHGSSVTNSKYVQLNTSDNSDVRIASYATTALTNELTSKGKINLVNGQVEVSFDSKLIELCDLSSLVITATPMGNCNGVYIDNITERGFEIKEINNGSHNVSVSFIISGTLKNATQFTEPDILNKQYETNMNGVMHNDYDTETTGTPIWYDGQNVRHDAVDEELTGRRALKEAQGKENEKLLKPTKKAIEEK